MPSHGMGIIKQSDPGNYQALSRRQTINQVSDLNFEVLREAQLFIAILLSALSFTAWIVSYSRREEVNMIEVNVSVSLELLHEPSFSRTLLFLNIRLLIGVQFSWLSILLNSILDGVPNKLMCNAIFTAESLGYLNYLKNLGLPLFLVVSLLKQLALYNSRRTKTACQSTMILSFETACMHMFQLLLLFV